MSEGPADNTDRILAEALRAASEIWTNEDRRDERRPGYTAEATIKAAVELAGAVIALDAFIRAGRPIPGRWTAR